MNTLEKIRADTCAACVTPCAGKQASERANLKCPAGRWKNAKASNPEANAAKIKGLGDVVAIVAEPIARALRIDPAKCGCKGRQEKLNRLVPFS